MYIAPRSRVIRAFTLIELLIVLVILILMVTIAIPSFSQLFKTSKVTQAAHIIMGVLWRASGEAERLHEHVAVYYGDKQGPWPKPELFRADGIGGWQIVDPPAQGRLEVWTVKPWQRVAWGSRAPFNSVDPLNKFWIPWKYQLSPLTPGRGVTLPEGIRVMAVSTASGGYFNGTTSLGFANYQRSKEGEMKRHCSVFSNTGSTSTYESGAEHAYNIICVFEESSGEHVLISVGEHKRRARPKIIGYNYIKKVGTATAQTTLNSLSELPRLFDNFTP